MSPRPSTGALELVRRLLVCAWVACAAASGCRERDEPSLSGERFVDAYMALVRARVDTEGDPAAYAAARDLALQRVGVTSEEMREFVQRGRQDPERLQVAWQAIAARLDTLYGGVTTAPPPELQGEVPAELEGTPLPEQPPAPAPRPAPTDSTARVSSAPPGSIAPAPSAPSDSAIAGP